MSEMTDLEAPALLIAMPQVQDPFFHKSVVLLLHQDDEGSFGFIVNRPTDLPVQQILEGMEIGWQGDAEALAYLGGPVQPQVRTILFDSAVSDLTDPSNGNASEAFPGVGMTQHINDLALLAAEPPASFRLFLGYSGWGEGQLVEEILRDDWIVAPIDQKLLFKQAPDTVWEAALGSVGVDANSLPIWARSETENATN